MNCPKCGRELRRSSQEPNMGLCDNCMMKFDWVETITCRNCGIQFNGNFCPRCGTPAKSSNHGGNSNEVHQKKKKTGCLIALLIAVIILVFMILLAGISGSDSEESNNTKPESAAEDKEEEITVGSSFEVDDLKITTNEANTDFNEYEDEYGYLAPENGMKYIMVSFTFENIGESGDKYVSIYDFDCYADDASCEQEYSLDDSSFINTNLSPGRNVSFKTYYIVPFDTKSIELEYKESMLDDDRVKIKIQ